MSLTKLLEFGRAWNSQDANYVAEYFTEDGELHTSLGMSKDGNSYYGRAEIVVGANIFFKRFPQARFENIVGHVSNHLAWLEWDFVWRDQTGRSSVTAGCDLLSLSDGLIRRKSAFRKVLG